MLGHGGKFSMLVRNATANLWRVERLPCSPASSADWIQIFVRSTAALQTEGRLVGAESTATATSHHPSDLHTGTGIWNILEGEHLHSISILHAVHNSQEIHRWTSFLFVDSLWSTGRWINCDLTQHSKALASKWLSNMVESTLICGSSSYGQKIDLSDLKLVLIEAVSGTKCRRLQ